MLNKTGVASKEEILEQFSQEGKLHTYKAILECYEEIPCNPCATSCPVGAIAIEPNIHAQPHINLDICTGCAICVAICPGLSIMLAKLSEDKAYFKIPYEMNEVFEKGMRVHALNRSGEKIGEARILSVTETKQGVKTKLIEVEVDRTLLHEFVTIQGQSYG